MFFNQEIAQILNNGGVAVIPTDTIYGVVALAGDKSAVKKVHNIKKRSPNKPCIILISNAKQMLQFGVDELWVDISARYWPGPVSLIVPTAKNDIDYLTCSTGTLAFRLPDNNDLTDLIDNTGPLIAPSANPEGDAPATTISQAKSYFKDIIDIYVDGGDCSGRLPSRLIDLQINQILR